ncbi:MAG: alpha-amylase family glycosyl hydrolase [Candidatus Eisenbacteria bacterium]
MAAASFEKLLRLHFPFGFPVTLEAGYRFDLLQLSAAADPDLSRRNVQAVRSLAHRVNERKDGGTYRPDPVKAESLFALGLIADAMRYVVLDHCHRERPGILGRARERAAALLGEKSVRDVPLAFLRLYPPQPLVRALQPQFTSSREVEEREEYREATKKHLGDLSLGLPNRDLVDVEVILLYLAMRNPATRPVRDLFDDTPLQHRAPYVPYVVGLEEFFDDQPPLGRFGRTLFHSLRAPMHAAPHSLEEQLRFIREHWAGFLPRHILDRITLALDIWEEDRRFRGFGPGSVPVLEFGLGRTAEAAPEAEAFTKDKDWMSNVVLMAKNTHVWLDQLSKKHGRAMGRLSDIPDEELDRLARWGFGGLWLIGLWERSNASRKIKQYTGNPEAVASAYSLDDYRIADDLGGEEAYRDLRERAAARGIRLASDMVPNHMGIDSRWVREHPHWFLGLDHPPYPWYTFGGGDLSDDPRVGVYIEDGYWERRDAAVVFRRVDRETGENRYIYHGNDGTSMPWNDTAQLNFLLPEVREGVIRTILHVARRFPIIRFDAAMTLAKRHYQRLWYPQPGDAGAIPSRAEHGMTKEEFDRRMPVEFWREVVDRIAAEAPDTLLLAEAFWLMEGYFVRTLGMHRVYNSAFMNMLKMEENQKYRQTIKNVLEFSPEVLKRFVNFMSNPDERTAVEQFGKGDKYFGVCMLMVTMPGLPMFGHGQIEGFAEKYGMEYQKAYWDEMVDEQMVIRHEAEIFPLMRMRSLFSGAGNFVLFDFVREGGGVDENVFAYANRSGDERGLVLFNNVYERTAGSIRESTAINVGSADAPRLVRRTLREALGLDGSEGVFYSFRDAVSGLEFLRSGRELAERGLFAPLDGYRCHAFIEWREHRDGDGRWAELARRLSGAPVPSVDRARRELELEPVLLPFVEAVKAAIGGMEDPKEDETGAGEGARERYLDAVVARLGSEKAPDFLTKEAGAGTPSPVTAIARLMEMAGLADAPAGPEARRKHLAGRIEDWLLDRKAADALREMGKGHESAASESALAAIIAIWGAAPLAEVMEKEKGKSGAPTLEEFFLDPQVQRFLAVHEHDGVRWFHKERLERLVEALERLSAPVPPAKKRAPRKGTPSPSPKGAAILKAAEETGYRFDDMMKRLPSTENGASSSRRSTR